MTIYTYFWILHYKLEIGKYGWYSRSTILYQQTNLLFLHIFSNTLHFISMCICFFHIFSHVCCLLVLCQMHWSLQFFQHKTTQYCTHSNLVSRASDTQLTNNMNRPHNNHYSTLQLVKQQTKIAPPRPTLQTLIIMNHDKEIRKYYHNSNTVKWRKIFW